MDVVVQGISGLGIRQELEAHIYRESYDLYRGAIGRLIFVGTPHRGSRLVPYLNEVESRLKEMGLSRSFPRILPASGGEAFTWNDLIEGSNGSGSPLLNRMHPNDRLFRSESVYDPHTSVINLVTDIDSENAPAFKRVGLTGAALRAVFRLGTDGFLGLLSGTATSSVYDLGGQINGDRIREEDQWIAHGEPAEAFAADQSQTKSQKVAERINELFDKDNKGVPVFYTFARPSPLSIGEIESIRAAAQDVPLADIVDIESFLLGGNTSSGDSALLPHMQVFEEGVRKFEYQFDPPGSYPIVGEVFWTAELHGPDGVTSEGVSLETDSMDSSKVTVSVDPLVTGDVVLFLSYETTDGALVFGEPQWVTHQRPLLGDVDHMELLPDGHSLRIGESFESEVVTVYTDGTRLPRWLDPKAVENVSSSDPEVLSVANFPEVEALKAGVATLTVEAFGLMAEAQITVEAEPAALDYEDWKANFFSETELDDPSISGDSVDLDGDSLNLFLEFITGGDPRIPNPGFLPRITKVVRGSAEESVIGLRVSTRIADESVRAEHSTDLQDWNEIADMASSTALNNTSIVDYIEGDGYRELFLKLNESIPAFYRLSVQSSNP